MDLGGTLIPGPGEREGGGCGFKYPENTGDNRGSAKKKNSWLNLPKFGPNSPDFDNRFLSIR